MTTYTQLETGNYLIVCDGLNREGMSVQGVQTGKLYITEENFVQKLPRGCAVENGKELLRDQKPGTHGELIGMTMSDVASVFLSRNNP